MASSKDYWQKREAENLKKNLKTEEEYSKAINDCYEYMMDNIQKEINGFYAKLKSFAVYSFIFKPKICNKCVKFM